MVDEDKIKRDVDFLATNNGVQGYLFAYIDGEKLKFTGNMSLRALTPFMDKIVPLLMKRFAK